MSTPQPFSPSNDDWRISDKQRAMIMDRIPKMSKREASLVIRFIEHCIFGMRISELQKENKS